MAFISCQPTRPSSAWKGWGSSKSWGIGAEGLALGDKVGYGTGPMGAYAQYRTLPAAQVVKLPETVAPEIAAASMLKALDRAFFDPAHVRRGRKPHDPRPCRGRRGSGCFYADGQGFRGARHRHGGIGGKSRARGGNGCEFPILYKQEDVGEAREGHHGRAGGERGFMTRWVRIPMPPRSTA